MLALGLTVVLLAALAVPCTGEPWISAAHAMVMDADTGAVLYEKDPDTECLIASTTKIMTGLLICETCSLEDRLQVPAEAVGTEGSSMYLSPDEVVTVEDLLYGLLLASGNDAAVALALYCDGSLTAFTARMNARAETLGLTNTRFANPHGLDSEDNYSTARDLAKLGAAALKNPDFARIVGTKSVNAAGRCLTNHNKLLWQYPGALGVKTGYTKAAGRILVSAARRNGRTLVCVTISDPEDWADHAQLLDAGFSAYTPTEIVPGQALCTLPLAGAGDRTIPLLAAGAAELWLAPGETPAYRFDGPVPAFPPLEKGTLAGTVTVILGDLVLAELPVTWGADVKK